MDGSARMSAKRPRARKAKHKDPERGENLSGAPISAAAIPTSAMAVAVMAIAAVQNVPQLWIAYSLLGFAGAGTSGVTYLSAIYAQKDLSRGFTAAIIIAIGAGSGFLLWPLLMSFGVDFFGWRKAMILVGFFILTISLPACWRFFTVAKQRLNLSSDTTPLSLKPTSNQPQPQQRNNVSTETFFSSYRVYATVCFIFSMGIQGSVVHIVPILIEGGQSIQQAAATASLLGLAMVPILLIAGKLGDLYRPGALSAVFCLIAAAGIAFLSISHIFPDFAWIAVCAIAAGFGIEILIPMTIKGRYGTANFAKRYAVVFACTMFGRALGPWLLGVWRDQFGEYFTMVMAYALIVGLSAIYFAFYGAPQPKKDH